MFDTIAKPNFLTLLTAAIAVVCACHSEDQTLPLASQAVSAPTVSEAYSLVGTAPAAQGAEQAITPMETVGAAAN